MGLFAQALNDLGTLRLEALSAARFGRWWTRPTGQRNAWSALLAEMPFYQRRRLLQARAVDGGGPGSAGVARFDDLDRLTIFADNLVPHVLRVDGVLGYDAELLERINREELIAPGRRRSARFGRARCTRWS